jgi:hypothetical protein
MDRGADSGVGATAAEVAVHRFVDIGVCWGDVLREEGGGLHDLARLTVATLCDLMVDPSLLDHRNGIWRADPFDGGDGAPYIAERDLTGPNGLPIDVHSAGATGRDATAIFRAG